MVWYLVWYTEVVPYRTLPTRYRMGLAPLSRPPVLALGKLRNALPAGPPDLRLRTCCHCRFSMPQDGSGRHGSGALTFSCTAGANSSSAADAKGSMLSKRVLDFEEGIALLKEKVRDLHGAHSDLASSMQRVADGFGDMNPGFGEEKCIALHERSRTLARALQETATEETRIVADEIKYGVYDDLEELESMVVAPAKALLADHAARLSEHTTARERVRLLEKRAGGAALGAKRLAKLHGRLREARAELVDRADVLRNVEGLVDYVMSMFEFHRVRAMRTLMERILRSYMSFFGVGLATLSRAALDLRKLTPRPARLALRGDVADAGQLSFPKGV